jgi:Tfp pilus assembly protein PilP
MKKNSVLVNLYVCMAVLAIIIMLIPGCQGGGSSPAQTEENTEVETTLEVEPVKEEEPSTPVTVVEEKPITGNYIRKTSRDPFALPGIAANIDIPSMVFTNDGKNPDGTVKPTTGQKPGTVAPIYVKPEDIGVAVSGIMKTGGKYRAIITNKSGKDFVVTAGEEVGEWTVAQINADSVMLKAKNFYSKLVLESGISTPDMKKGSEKSEDTGPKVPSIPSAR